MKEVEIPLKYQEHHRVFSEEGAKRLPLTRVEDMEITLKEDAPEQLDCKVYPLSKKELEVRDAHRTVVRVRPYKCTVM